MEATATGSPPRKKARKGKKKSKAERLSRGLNLTTTTCSNDDQPTTTVSFEELQSLLNAPDATTSAHWDRAQAVAMRLATPQARQLMVRSLVFDRQAHKAAVHYARRLGSAEAELVAVLLEGRDDAQRCLAVARFLTEADTKLVGNATRITQFVVPWLDAHKAHSASDEQQDVLVPTAFATAARLVLQPNAAPKKPEIAAEKLALQRALVSTLLTDDQATDGPSHAGVVLQYASSFASELQTVRTLGSDVSTDSTNASSIDDGDAESLRRTALARRVETFLRMLWPDARVVVFGSSATKLLVPSASDDDVSSNDDVDLCALLPSCPQFLDDTASLVADIKDHLALYVGDDDIVAVTRARVPIVKWTDATTQLQCDLCVNNIAALWNTALTKALTRDANVRAFSRWIKQWYKAHRHVGGFAAGISSYGMQLLVFHFLQHDGVLPSSLECDLLTLDTETLQQPQLEAEIERRVLKNVQASAPSSTKKSLWSLVVGFFAFYGANAFDFEHNVVSLRAPRLTKADKQWTRRHWRFSLSIEDPIETARDLGTLFSRVSLTRFRTALVAACVQIADAYATGALATDSDRAHVLTALLTPSVSK